MSLKAIRNKKNNKIVSYEARIYLPKKIQQKIGKNIITKNFKTEYEAEKWIKDKKAEIELDIFNLGEKFSFEELVKEFIESVKKKWSKNTLPTFLGYVEKYFNPALFKIKLADLSKYDLKRFERFLNEKNLSDKTKHNICTGLRSVINFGIKKNYLDDKSIIDYIPRYKQKSNIKKVILTTEEVWKLTKEIEIEVIRDIIIFLFYTGLRISELCGLRFLDIDFENQLLTVNNQIFNKPNYNYELIPAKCRDGNNPDTIPLNLVAYNILIKYKELKTANNETYVFSDFKNRPLRKDGWVKFHYMKAVKKLKEKGILKETDKINLHTLRHSFLSKLAMEGENPKIIQLLARHKDFGFTYNTYIHNKNVKPKTFENIENEYKTLFS